MKRLFTNKNGHLKTGPVAVLVFSIIILFLGILVQYSKPLDKALVSVKHVLTAQPPLKPDSETVKPDVSNEPVFTAANAAPEMQHENTFPGPEAVDESPQEQPVSKKTFEEKAVEEPTVELPESDTSSVNKALPAVAESAADVSENRPFGDSEQEWIKAETGPVSKNTGNALAGKKAKPDFSKIPVETLKNLTRQQSSSRQTKDKPEMPKLNVSKTDINDRENSHVDIKIDISEKLAGIDIQRRKKPTEQLASLNLDTIEITPQPKVKTVKNPWPETLLQDQRKMEKSVETNQKIVKKEKNNSDILPINNAFMANENQGAVNLSSEHYLKILRNWQSEGNASSKRFDERIALRIENLRKAYNLFQMKPVAVTTNGVFIDLSDGSRISEAALKPYSSTVFLVENAWSKWGDTLKASGIRRSDGFEVRYYMYGFIKNAIYSRTYRAFEWCKRRGLIPQDLQPSQVDVLGRAYRIERAGGGEFGVFVPLALDIKNGTTIQIDPVCFAENPDVSELMSRGIL